MPALFKNVSPSDFLVVALFVTKKVVKSLGFVFDQERHDLVKRIEYSP